jgi:hypothetical protein
MEEYHFEHDYGTCKQKCMVKDSNVMIGSYVCQQCEHCKGNDSDGYFVSWIKCDKLTDALGE